MLEHCGATVRTAPSAAEALAMLAGERPDVLIADIGMPGEDGYSLIRKVRAAGEREQGALPAIALTAYATTSDRAEAKASGFDLHVAKPVTLEDLTLAILKLLGGRQPA
jgi:CheY-like chemotaxis protein